MSSLVSRVIAAIVTYFALAPKFTIFERERFKPANAENEIKVVDIQTYDLDRPEMMLVNEDETYFLSGVGNGAIKKTFIHSGINDDFLTPKDFNPSITDESICNGEPMSEFTCGRVLGMTWDNNYENIYIANAYLGIFRYNMESETLTPLHTGRKFYNDVAINPAGTKLYFTDSSTEFDRLSFLDLVIKNGKTGTLNEMDLTTFGVTELVNGIGFMNGIDVTADGNFLYFAETNSLKIWIYDINEKTYEVFLENIPVFPDNIEIDQGNNLLYIAGVERTKTMDWMISTTFVSQNLVKAPITVYAPLYVESFSERGVVVVANLETKEIYGLLVDDGTNFSRLASVHKVGERFYCGTVVGDKAVAFTFVDPSLEK